MSDETELRLIAEAHDIERMILPTKDETEARATLAETCTRLNDRFGSYWGQLLPILGVARAPAGLAQSARRMSRVSELKHALPVTDFGETLAILRYIDEALRRRVGMFWSDAYLQTARLPPRVVAVLQEANENVVPFAKAKSAS